MAEDHDYSQSNVPQEQRRGFWAMFVVMLGFTFFSASMWTGTTLGNGLTVSKFFLAVLLGNLILGAYTSALAYMASSTGLSVHLLARRSFGKRGSALPSAILAITQIGWFGVGVAMCAFPIVAYLKEKNIECNIWIPVIISGILFTTSAYFGIKALTIVSLVAVPAIAIGGGFSALKVFCDNPDAWNTLKNFTPAGDSALTLSAAVALTIGSFISGGTCTPDFVRFAKDRKIAVSTTAIAFFIGNSLMFLFGAVGGMFYKTNDISNVLVAQGLLIPGIIVLTFNIWTTNDNPQAIMQIVDLMDKYDIGYGSVNHNRNRCLDCGFENAEKDLHECPHCHGHHIDTLQRITGYLVGTTNRWNSGKLAELKDRVVHE